MDNKKIISILIFLDHLEEIKKYLQILSGILITVV